MKLLATGIALTGSLLASAANATLSICDATPGNLVQNCGFELHSFRDWSASGFVGLTGNANSGTWALNLIARPPVTRASLVSDNFTLNLGEDYTVSFYVQGITQIGTGGFGVSLLDSNDNAIGSWNTTSISGYTDWTKVSFNVIGNGDSGDTIDIEGFTNGAVLNWHADDFVVVAQPIPEPGTAALFGIALLALGGLGLRRKFV